MLHCSFCGNEDPTLFGEKNQQRYCRACIKYQQPIVDIPKLIPPISVIPNVAFALTEEQQKLSKQLLKAEKEVYLRAVCGAGKTEITYEAIVQSLQKGERVGFAIPRKEIVKELYSRLKCVFPSIHIAAVYGGHQHDLQGDIIILTTHQIYRYPGKFGLLIVDEYDAFPFYQNRILHHFVSKACYGKSIYLSATFHDNEIRDRTVYELNKRYHQHPLPLPKIHIHNEWFLLKKLIQYVKDNQGRKPIWIYVSSIKKGQNLSRIFTFMKIEHLVLSSKSSPETLQSFHRQSNGICITTTLLERGMTKDNVSVVVYRAEAYVFDVKTLIQIAGRVGRTKQNPSGDVLFLATKKTSAMEQVAQTLKQTNEKVFVLSH